MLLLGQRKEKNALAGLNVYVSRCPGLGSAVKGGEQEHVKKSDVEGIVITVKKRLR